MLVCEGVILCLCVYILLHLFPSTYHCVFYLSTCIRLFKAGSVAVDSPFAVSAFSSYNGVLVVSSSWFSYFPVLSYNGILR